VAEIREPAGKVPKASSRLPQSRCDYGDDMSQVYGRGEIQRLPSLGRPESCATCHLLAKFLLKGKRGGVVEKAQRVKIAFLVVVSCPHCAARAGDRHSCEENGEKIIHRVSDRQP